MSCQATVVVTATAGTHDGGAMLAHRAVTRLHELEQRWSRFLPTSEISGLNLAGGEARIASSDTVRLVRALVEAWHATDGAFDPTLLGTLVELGYAASRDDATLRTSLAADTALRGRPGDILVDAASGWVRLPRGTVLDPGGLGKGLAADIVTEEIMTAGAGGVLVEIGGDIRVVGTPPTGDAWPIAIAALTAHEAPLVVELVDGGVRPRRRVCARGRVTANGVIICSTSGRFGRPTPMRSRAR